MSSINDAVNTTSGNQDNISGQLDLQSIGLETAVRLNAAFPKMTPKNQSTILHEEINGTQNGAVLYVMNEEGAFSHVTNKFYLTGVNFSNSEKAQVTETFEGASLSFFGERVKTYTFTGAALDYGADGIIGGSSGAAGFQLSSLIKLYNEQLRATKLVANKNLAILRVLNHTIMGYPINFSAGYQAAQDKMGSFNMTWVIVKHSLTLPGVVHNRDLDALVSKEVAQGAAQAIQNIDQVVTSINSFILCKNYEGLESVGGVLFPGGIKALESKLSEVGNLKEVQANFIGALNAAHDNVKLTVLQFLSDESGMISPTVATYFGATAESIEAIFAESSTAINNLYSEDLNSFKGSEWINLKDTISKASSLKDTLLQNKSRL
tara:strand:- start:2209 stop:3342 length:1134 start_codon:yes stop_codon:yes gene_type:complete